MLSAFTCGSALGEGCCAGKQQPSSTVACPLRCLIPLLPLVLNLCLFLHSMAIGMACCCLRCCCRYLALVLGCLEGSGIIDYPLEGKPALSLFRAEAHSQSGEAGVLYPGCWFYCRTISLVYR